MSPHNLPSAACGGGQGGGLTLIPMARPQISPYGSWRSPVTADAIVAGVIGLSQIQLDGEDIYWVEGRPAEAGRNVIVRRRPDGQNAGANPGPGERFLRIAARQPFRHALELADLEPPEHALGWHRAVGRRADAGRTSSTPQGGRRGWGIDLPAVLVARWHAVF